MKTFNTCKIVLQRDVRLLVQPLIEEAIQEMNKFSSSKTINIADLGCCFGPNTLSSVQTIVDAMIHKHTLHGADSCHHEFQVFFNDRPTNDFNALFTSLPSNRPYFSAGVPGSFYGRLFPKASLHFVHSSYALHWLSELPNEVMDVNSPAWNKGRIYYAGGPMAVVEAYRTQFLKDLEVFLNARAEETVCGGLMTLLFPTQEEEIGPINSPTALCLNLLGSALMEIANEGLIEESQVDSFNFPAFCPSAEEFQKAVEKNGFFSIERQEILRVPSNHSEKEGWQLVKPKIEKAIHEKFKIDEFPSTKTFNITDLGCSTGPNTFSSMQTILDAMVQKCQLSEDSSYTHEFQVFFNDHCSNDFNTLFTSLPSDRRYFAAGIPGSFHGRLFPKASLHFVNSSYSLHWLSEVPKEVMDMNSPAWNRGRIHYVGGPKEVVEAYKKQYMRDLEVFLSARAEEMVCGGLMALLLVGKEEEIEPLDTPYAFIGRFIEMVLVEMASEGLIEEAQIDSFNVPSYNPTAEDFKNVVDKNGYFSIETLEVLCSPSECNEVIDSKAIAKHIRAFTESLICKHFGNEVMDEIYMRFENKVKENAHLLKSTNVALPALFVLLKRKNDHQLA